MKITIKYFAILRQLTGKGEEEWELPEGATVATLQSQLQERYETLQGRMDRVALAVNHSYATTATNLNDGDEVALLPPVGGGNGIEQHPPAWSDDQRFGITDQPLQPDLVRSLVGHAGGGAIVDFVGMVRERNLGKDVTRLEYEAYPAMVVAEFERLADKVEEKWPGSVVAIQHRMGRLTIGDLAVVISVCTPHRAEAFEACSFTIEQLKETAPIWKREVYDDESEWIGWGP